MLPTIYRKYVYHIIIMPYWIIHTVLLHIPPLPYSRNSSVKIHGCRWPVLWCGCSPWHSRLHTHGCPSCHFGAMPFEYSMKHHETIEHKLPWCLLCKSHTDPIQPIAPCRVLIILTQESHGVIAKRVGPGARLVGSSSYLGVPITISVQGKQFSYMWPFMLDVALETAKTAANTW